MHVDPLPPLLEGLCNVVAHEPQSVFGDDRGDAWLDTSAGEIRDVRLRVAGVHHDRAIIERLLGEITALYTCGPAGGGGIRTACTARLNHVSCFVPRELVPATYTILE